MQKQTTFLVEYISLALAMANVKWDVTYKRHVPGRKKNGYALRGEKIFQHCFAFLLKKGSSLKGNSVLSLCAKLFRLVKTPLQRRFDLLG